MEQASRALAWRQALLAAAERGRHGAKDGRLGASSAGAEGPQPDRALGRPGGPTRTSPHGRSLPQESALRPACEGSRLTPGALLCPGEHGGRCPVRSLVELAAPSAGV